MTTYKDTAEFYAVKLKYIDRGWLETVNEEMGKSGGNARLESIFSNFKCISLDLTKRILPKRQKK